MGLQLTPEQHDFYQAIDEILWNDWDPIGVNTIPEARNEYVVYVRGTFDLAIRNSDSTAIAEYLDLIASVTIAVGSNPTHSRAIASKICELRESFNI